MPIRITSVKAPASMGITNARDIVARVDKKLVGAMSFGSSTADLNKLKVTNVRVSAQFRGNGVATSLYDHLLNLAKKTGAKEIGSTDIINKGALAIRNKFGSSFFSRNSSGLLKKIDFKKALGIVEDLNSTKTVRAITKIVK